MASKPCLHGAMTALVTPFTDDATNIDFDAFEHLVARQLEGDAGRTDCVRALVPCGTTGESPSLTEEEKLELVRRTVQVAGGRATVIAGTGSNCTRQTMHLSQVALRAGADALMLVMPYYNRPSQQGLAEHVIAVARCVDGAPIVLYNVPSRCSVDLANDTLERILENAPNVVALKDATGNVLRCQQIVARFGERITVLCGDDALTLPMMLLGAKGVISVTSNVYPHAVARVCEAALAGDWEEARRAHFSLLGVHEAMFVEPNPGPVKAALAYKKLVRLALRLPMTTPSPQAVSRVVEVMQRYEGG